MEREQTYDLIIIGSGIAGAMLAAAMARNGVRVLLLEAGQHPKFAIGESMILETSEIMRSLARVFDVPELEYFSAENFLPRIGSSHGVKRHFSFLPHKEGQAPDPADIIQAVIPKDPYGHELHIFRQDSDSFYVATAVKYGAEVLQNHPVAEVDFDAHGVTVITKEGTRFSGRYVVDASGRGSLIARKFNLRHTELKTHTRGLFTHMTGVPALHKTFKDPDALGIPFSLAEGTLHHMFEGGWLWVIPFNNHPEAHNPLCSVGLLLDPRVHGPVPNLTPEEEFEAFIARFPAISAHLQDAKAVRPWVRGDRLQYGARAVVGDRYALLGHAAGFIDPLFSKGLYTSLAAVLRFGTLFLEAHRSGDYGRNAFLPLERQTLNFVDANDRLVASAIRAFAFPALWRAYAVIWITGAYLELVRLTTFRQSLLKHCRTRQECQAFPLPDLALVGGGFQPFVDLARQAEAWIEAVPEGDGAQASRAAVRLREAILEQPWIPESHKQIALGKAALPRNKFRLQLLRHPGGVLGQEDYRQHFFADTSLPDLAVFLMAEKWRYRRGAGAGRGAVI